MQAEIKRKHSVLRKFMLSYLMVLTIPLMIGTIVYDRVVEMMENEAIQSNQQALEQSKLVLDQRFEEIERIVQELAFDPKVQQFMQIEAPFEGANTYKVIELQQSLQDYSSLNRFMFQYYLFFRNNGVVMSSNQTHSLPFYYPDRFRYDNYSYEEWSLEFLNKYHHRDYWPAQSITIDGKASTMVTYLQSFGRLGSYHGVVAVLIDEQEMVKLLGGADLSGGGSVCVRDGEGRVITCAGSGTHAAKLAALALPGEAGVLHPDPATGDMMVTYTTSSFNGWTYMAAQPQEVVLQKVLFIRKLTFMILLISGAAGLAAASILAYRNTRPVRKLLQTLTERIGMEAGPSSPSRDAYGYIEASVDRLIASNELLHAGMQEQLPFLRAAFWDRFLSGAFGTASEIEAHMQHIGLTPEGGSFAAVLLHIRGHEQVLNERSLYELDMKRLLVKELLLERIGSQGYTHDIDGDKLAIILIHPDRLNGDASDYLRFEKILEPIAEQLRHPLNIPATLAIGGPCSLWTELPASYEQARQTLFRGLWEPASGIFHYADSAKLSAGYDYPLDLEMRILHCAKSGNEEELLGLLEELYRRNTADRPLSAAMFRLFLNNLWGTVIKLLEELPVEDGSLLREVKERIESSESWEDAAGMYASVKETFIVACRYVNQKKKSRNSELIDAVRSYMEEHYQDDSLSLLQIAEYFRLSEVYMSQLFKEQAGITFSDYLEALRMNEAARMLRDTAVPVNDVASRVGYHSAGTFRRAFKRVHGISPSDYRSLQEHG